MKKFNLDSHKLHYHFDRVAEFAKNGDCAPLYMEVSPVGLCNHRCIFCAYDYIGYPNRRLEPTRFLEFIKEVSEAGLRSMLYAGEGEPLVHPNIGEFVKTTKSCGIDVGMFSNGQLLSLKLAEEILPSLTFLRFSFNAGSKENYSKIHGVSGRVFERVVENIRYACEFRKKERLEVDLGSQFVLLPENMEYLLSAIRTLKACGVDYLSVKPFVQQNGAQHYKLKHAFKLDELRELIRRANEESTENFKVLFRENAFENYGERSYCHCYGTSFITVLNSAGELASCLPYWDQAEYVYGNINKASFGEIWAGERRARIKRFLEKELDTKKCPPNCRPNAINGFLSEIIERDIKHINFI